MAMLKVFNNVSLDGYFKDASSDMSWAHKSDPEWQAFAAGNASGDATLLFGRITYEQMASFWPTPAALRAMPEVAKAMNARHKVVFSRTLEHAAWQNTKLMRKELVGEVEKLKAQGPDVVVLGSGSLVAQLVAAGLVDQLQLVLHPVALGAGATLFRGLVERVEFKLTSTRSFENGCVALCYER